MNDFSLKLLFPSVSSWDFCNINRFPFLFFDVGLWESTSMLFFSTF